MEVFIGTEQRRRIERAFREAHLVALKPRGFVLKKMTSVRREEVMTSVRVELTPGAREDHYPVEVVYLAGVSTSAAEPMDFVWGVTGSVADASGHPRLMVHEFGAEELAAELTVLMERQVVPFLDRFKTVNDLIDYFRDDWNAEERYLQPQAPLKRLKYLTYFARVAGRADIADSAGAELAAVATTSGWAEDVTQALSEIEDRVARTESSRIERS